MKYSDLTRRYFDAPPHVGRLEGTGVRRGSAGEPRRGTWVQFDLVVADGVIADSRFFAFGCPHTIACAAWVAEHGVGKPVDAASESAQVLRQRFAVPVEKLGRLLIIEDAWVAARGAAPQV